MLSTAGHFLMSCPGQSSLLSSVFSSHRTVTPVSHEETHSCQLRNTSQSACNLLLKKKKRNLTVSCLKLFGIMFKNALHYHVC